MPLPSPNSGHNEENTIHSGENISNNTSIPIHGGPACRGCWGVGGAPGGPAERIRAALLFEKSVRPAGQPTMYLASPIHCGGYSIGINILLNIFVLLCVVFSLLWLESKLRKKDGRLSQNFDPILISVFFAKSWRVGQSGWIEAVSGIIEV